jgi:hypothetical protein
MKPSALCFFAILAAGCGNQSLIFAEPLTHFCGDAPCGWQLTAGSAALHDGTTLLDGASSISRVAPVSLDFAPNEPYPGYLVVLSQGDSTIDLRWIGADMPDDALEQIWDEPTYLYFFLQPPSTADAFALSLSTATGESANVQLVGVTKCAPFSGSNRHVTFGTADVDGRILSWDSVAAKDNASFGHECPSGGGDDGDGAGD